MLGAAAALREATGSTGGTVSLVAERVRSEQVVASTRMSLGEDAHDGAFAEGRAMEVEQAVKLALDLAANVQASSP